MSCQLPDSFCFCLFLFRLQRLGPEEQPGHDSAETGNQQEQPHLRQCLVRPPADAGPRLRAGFTLTPVMWMPKM